MTRRHVVYDAHLRRPACPILQAVLGGDVGATSQFDSEDWLVHPTPDMKCYLATDEELSKLVLITRAARAMRQDGR